MNQPISLYNSLTKSLVPLNESLVTWYCCGPTIYDSAHLGHASTYVSFDIVRRVMEYYGYTVIYCMNITDVDDKIQYKLKSQGISHKALVDKYETEFFDDMKSLNVKLPTSIIRVSENIDTIQQYILQILKKGFAYVSGGSIYIDSEAYISQGLVWDHFNCCNSETGDTTHVSEKRNPRDFALWKKASDGDVLRYSSEIFGIKEDGKPGWHIECSAMCNKLFGSKLTLHSGGIDLIYPHHNNEIIQGIAHSDSSIDVFIHSGHLHIEGCKMAKSLKNFITIQEALATKINSRQLRVMFLLHNYNDQLDYSDGVISNAINFDEILSNYLSLISSKLTTNNDVITEPINFKYLEELNLLKSRVDTSLRNNIDTNNVMLIIRDFLAMTHKYIIDTPKYNINNISSGLQYIIEITSMFGLNYGNNNTLTKNTEQINKLMDLIVDTRSKIRESLKKINKDKSVIPDMWKTLDDLRQKSLELGIIIEDFGEVTTWRHVV